MPIHVAAGTKAVLAFSSPELVNKLINGNLKRYTSNTTVDPDEFKKHLEVIRLQGFSIDRGEFNEDVFAIGVPIFNHRGEPIAGISLCALPTRMKSLLATDVVSHIKEAADNISIRLFGKVNGDSSA